MKLTIRYRPEKPSKKCEVGGEALSRPEFERLTFAIAPAMSGRLLVAEVLLESGGLRIPFRRVLERVDRADYILSAQIFEWVGRCLGAPSNWITSDAAGSDCLSDPRFSRLEVEIAPSAGRETLHVEALLRIAGEADRTFGFPLAQEKGERGADFAIASIVMQKVERALGR